MCVCVCVCTCGTYLCDQCRAEECWGRWTQRRRWSNWFVFHPSQDPPRTTHPAFYLCVHTCTHTDTQTCEKTRKLANGIEVGQIFRVLGIFVIVFLTTFCLTQDNKVGLIFFCIRLSLTCIENTIRAPAGS